MSTCMTTAPVLVAGAWPAGVFDRVGAVPELELTSLGTLPAEEEVLRRLIGRAEDPWLLLGAGMDDADRLCLLRTVRAIRPGVRLAVLGPAENAGRVSRWLSLGCDAYLFEDITGEALLGVLQIAGPDLVIVDRRCRPPAAEPDAARLTDREREILDLLCAGQGNSDMAKVLRLSRRTVEFHLTRIFEKLKVTSRTEAIARAWHGAV
ncbi:response regulator transcription factor [Amycolatopsis magusensis]|uniref:response regulator transcription factor n=1 Tax=Amycolatopsis magusensis TaxID=882444 RepID=UPI003C2FAE49